MSEWPKRYECLDLDEDIDYNTPERWIQCVSLEDFDRLLEFSISAMQALGQTDRDREAIRHDIFETIQDRIWREKNGNMAD
jgi:hypothetical protein